LNFEHHPGTEGGDFLGVATELQGIAFRSSSLFGDDSCQEQRVEIVGHRVQQQST
jgi:hypothetical protein